MLLLLPAHPLLPPLLRRWRLLPAGLVVQGPNEFCNALACKK